MADRSSRSSAAEVAKQRAIQRQVDKDDAGGQKGKSGAMRMVEEGALAGLDAVFGIHVDPTKDVGVIATRSGPLMAAADAKVQEVERQYRRGLLTDDEREERTITIWTEAKDQLAAVVKKTMNPVGNLSVMAISGATL